MTEDLHVVTPNDRPEALDPAMIDAAMRRLLTAAPSAIRLLLASEGPATELVEAVSERSGDPGWNGSLPSLEESVNAYVNEGATGFERLHAALEANVIASFDSPGWPSGYLLHGAAITSSPRWAGDAPEDDADRALGAKIIADRRRHFDELDALWEPLLRRGMADLGLRPQGRTPVEVVRLMHCLLDGAVLRMFIDPTLQAADVADALVRFGMALGEPGPLADPRRPANLGQTHVFDQIVLAALRWWSEHRTETFPGNRAIAQDAGVPLDVYVRMFPSDGDLADSAVRALVVDGGFLSDDGALPHPTLVPALIVGGVTRLAEVADAHRGLFEFARSMPPSVGRSFRAEAIDEVLALLEPFGTTGEMVGTHVPALVDAAWLGSAALSIYEPSIAEIRKLVGGSERT